MNNVFKLLMSFIKKIIKKMMILVEIISMLTKEIVIYSVSTSSIKIKIDYS